jgi:UDP-2,3-diacylglucosamine hydrolase
MAIGDRAGHESRKSSVEQRRNSPAREILKPYAKAILATGYQAIVTGHYHQPFHEKLGDGELIALGDWITQYSYAVYEDHAFTLKSYSATSGSTKSEGSTNSAT